MSRTRAADDFDTIRSRLDELRRESAPQETPRVVETKAPTEWVPDAVAHVPPPTRIPVPSSTNRPGAV